MNVSITQTQLQKWQYCELYWTIPTWTPMDPENPWEAENALKHKFTFNVSIYPAENDKDRIPHAYIDRIKHVLISASEDDLAGLWGDLSDVYRNKGIEVFRDTQLRVLASLGGDSINVIPQVYLANLGLEGWELVTIREEQSPDLLNFHENVHLQLPRLNLIYYLKRPIINDKLQP